jgi:transcriptional regulator with XRE-family HTH domain
MESFGQYLKAAREARKISLREISRVTRISRTILEALERDRRELLLPEVVIKGFIEAYARYCGLDPKEVLSNYSKRQAGNAAAKKRKSVHDGEQGLPLRYLFAGATGLIIIIVASLFALPGRSPREGGQEVALAKGAPGHKKMVSPKGLPSSPSPLLVTEKASLSSPPVEAQDEKEKSSLVREHLLVIKASERTWVQIQDGSSLPFDIILYRGESYTRKSSHPLAIVIGNAGTVTVTFDGKELETLGGAGEVVKLKLPSLEEG